MPDVQIGFENDLSEQMKYELIQNIQSNPEDYKDPIEILKKLSKDISAHIRSSVAEALIEFSEIEAERILIELLKDSDYMVRVCACESLRYGQTRESFLLLKERLIHDQSNMVRRYAVAALADIAKNSPSVSDPDLFPFLINRLNSEKTKRVKIWYYQSLYRLGAEIYLKYLLKEIDNRNYWNRIFVIKLLREIINNETKDMILPLLKQRFYIEKIRLVRDILEEVLNECE